MISIPPQTAADLPIDELAFHVLQDIVNNREDSEYNYLYHYTEDSTRGYHASPQGYNAIAESIAWLRSRAMIAHKPLDNRSGSIMVTRWGHEALKSGIKTVRAVERLQDNLHPTILQKARRQFLLGEYEMAIFASMKAVEVRVRKLAEFPDAVIGVDLMNRAFKKDGPLADMSAPDGEVTGMMMLFSGSFAVLRNPSGHREVEFDDVTEASEAVMTASMLMRILDKIEARVSA